VTGKIIQISDPGRKGSRFGSDVFIRLVNYEKPRLSRNHQIVYNLIKFFRRLPVVRDVSPVSLMLIKWIVDEMIRRRIKYFLD